MLDPNDFVDVDEAFEDSYDPDKISLATFTIVPGDEVSHASLIFQEDGISFLGGSSGTKWGISLYQGYHYNGQDIPIDDNSARHILEVISGTDNLEEFEWQEYNWAYFE